MNEVFNVDAETAVLSIVLNNPEKIYDIFVLREDMFTSSPNQIIWRIIQDIGNEKHLPEFNLIVSRLKEKRKFEKAGGIDYLTYLKSQVFKPENLDDFMRQILDNYKTKSMISISAKITGALENGDNVDALITGLRGTLDDLENTSSDVSTVTMEIATRTTWADIEERIAHPGLRGISTGLKDLDDITAGYCENDVWIIAGRPSIGKSAVMFNSALATAKLGNNTLIFSKEMDLISCTERLLALETEIPITDVRSGVYTQKTIDALADGVRRLKSLPLFIDVNCFNIAYVISVIRKYVRFSDVRIVFIDYIQLFSENSDNLSKELGSYTRRLKRLAKELHITIVVLSQLNRGVEMRDDKRPLMSDLRESGDLEQDADNIIMLYREDYYYKDKSKHPGEIEYLIRKQRNGPIGVLFFKFDAPTNIITGDTD